MWTERFFSRKFQALQNQGPPVTSRGHILVPKYPQVESTYRLQRTNVKWNNEASYFFDIGNGVKQGAVLSAVFYCVYTNAIFKELRRMNIRCCIGQNYVGVIGYADDLFLMCPTLDGLQKMLNVCEKYASDHNLCFSTDPDPNKSKTKCMAFLQKKRNIRNLSLCGNPWSTTPWVTPFRG